MCFSMHKSQSYWRLDKEKFLYIYIHFIRPIVGLSNKTTDPTHLAKPTGPKLATTWPDYLVVGGGSLPSQANSSGLSGGYSLPKPDPLNPIVYITQFLVILYSPLQFRPSPAHSPSVSLSTHSLNLTSESHALNLSHAQKPTPLSIWIFRSSNLHHRWAMILLHCTITNLQVTLFFSSF